MAMILECLSKVGHLGDTLDESSKVPCACQSRHAGCATLDNRRRHAWEHMSPRRLLDSISVTSGVPGSIDQFLTSGCEGAAITHLTSGRAGDSIQGSGRRRGAALLVRVSCQMVGRV